MSYILKDGYLEIKIADGHQRTGECKAGEALKQGMIVSKGKDGSGNPVVTKASGSEVKQGNAFVVAYYEISELDEINSGLLGLVGAIASGKRVVTLGNGVRVATDQYVGSIGDYEVGDFCEVGTSGNAGLLTNLNATPVGDAVARVVALDGDKLVVDIIL